MPPEGFELTISDGERPQTYTLDRAATETGIHTHTHTNTSIELGCNDIGLCVTSSIASDILWYELS